MDDLRLLLEKCFLGIPGKCSQENGTPENLSGEAGLRGGSSGKQNDSREEDEGENDDEQDEKEAVRREDGYFPARIHCCFWCLRFSEESIVVFYDVNKSVSLLDHFISRAYA